MSFIRAVFAVLGSIISVVAIGIDNVTKPEVLIITLLWMCFMNIGERR